MHDVQLRDFGIRLAWMMMGIIANFATSGRPAVAAVNSVTASVQGHLVSVSQVGTLNPMVVAGENTDTKDFGDTSPVAGQSLAFPSDQASSIVASFADGAATAQGQTTGSASRQVVLSNGELDALILASTSGFASPNVSKTIDGDGSNLFARVVDLGSMSEVLTFTVDSPFQFDLHGKILGSGESAASVMFQQLLPDSSALILYSITAMHAQNDLNNVNQFLDQTGVLGPGTYTLKVETRAMLDLSNVLTAVPSSPSYLNFSASGYIHLTPVPLPSALGLFVSGVIVAFRAAGRRRLPGVLGTDVGV